MKRLLVLFIMVGIGSWQMISPSQAQDKNVPKDSRLGKPLTYNGYFPWTPPKNLQEWEKRREFVKTQVLVANGLWPLPQKTPLNPVIHSPIER